MSGFFISRSCDLAVKAFAAHRPPGLAVSADPPPDGMAGRQARNRGPLAWHGFVVSPHRRPAGESHLPAHGGRPPPLAYRPHTGSGNPLPAYRGPRLQSRVSHGHAQSRSVRPHSPHTKLLDRVSGNTPSRNRSWGLTHAPHAEWSLPVVTDQATCVTDPVTGR